MKQNLATISIFILTLTLHAQSETDSSNIYLQALTEHLKNQKDFNQEWPALIKIPNIYYIEKDWITTDNFPMEIDGQKIELLTREEIIKKVKGDKSIQLLAVRPVQWKNGKMEIHVNEFAVSGTKRNLNYVNQSNGSSFRIKSGSDCQRLVIEKIKN